MPELLTIFDYLVGIAAVMGAAVLIGKPAAYPASVAGIASCKTCMSFWCGILYGVLGYSQGAGLAGFSAALVAPFLFWLILLGRSSNAAL